MDHGNKNQSNAIFCRARLGGINRSTRLHQLAHFWRVTSVMASRATLMKTLDLHASIVRPIRARSPPISSSTSGLRLNTAFRHPYTDNTAGRVDVDSQLLSKRNEILSAFVTVNQTLSVLVAHRLSLSCIHFSFAVSNMCCINTPMRN